MFFILCVKEGKSGLVARLSDHIHPPSVSTEKIEVENILPFYRITAVKHRGQIPWKQIEAAAGKLCKRAIIENGLEPPADSAIKRYKSEIFPQRVLFESAVSQLKKLRLDPLKMSVTVFDEIGCLADLTEKLVMLSSAISIVTSCPRSYEKVRDELLSKYGVSVIISSSADESILQSTVIISDKSADIPLVYRGLLFTNERRKMLNATLFCGEEITLPKELEALCPASADKMTFAGALYELCAAKQLEGTRFNA